MSDSAQVMHEDALRTFTQREPRSEADWAGLIRTTDGIEISCKIKNVSKTGAKISVSEAHHLPETFMLKFGKDFVLRVRLAWRKGNFAGLKVEQIAKLSANG